MQVDGTFKLTYLLDDRQGESRLDLEPKKSSHTGKIVDIDTLIISGVNSLV